MSRISYLQNALSLRKQTKAYQDFQIFIRGGRVLGFLSDYRAKSRCVDHVTMLRKLEASPYARVVRGTFAMGVVGSYSQGSWQHPPVWNSSEFSRFEGYF